MTEHQRSEQPAALPWIIAGLAMVALAPTLDLLAHQAPSLHAIAVTGFIVVAATSTWLLTERLDLAFIAAATLALWPLTYLAPSPILLAGIAIGLILLIPRTWSLRSRTATALLAGLMAAAIASLLLPGAIPVATAGLTAATLAAARPVDATGGVLGMLRNAALALPATGLIALVILNAGTGRLELDPYQAVTTGLLLALLLTLISLALLGLETLLASSHPLQWHIWLAGAIGLGLLLATIPLKSPARTLEAIALIGVPLVMLATTAAGRLQHALQDAQAASWIMWALPPLLAGAGFIWLASP